MTGVKKIAGGSSAPSTCWASTKAFGTLQNTVLMGHETMAINIGDRDMGYRDCAKAFGTLVLIMAISACAMVSETYMPDGSKGYSISCDGAAVGINVCFEKAGNLCGAVGYDIITREGQIVPYGTASASVQGTATQVQGQSFATYGSFNTKSIMVRCRNQAGAAPG